MKLPPAAEGDYAWFRTPPNAAAPLFEAVARMNRETPLERALRVLPRRLQLRLALGDMASGSPARQIRGVRSIRRLKDVRAARPLLGLMNANYRSWYASAADALVALGGEAIAEIERALPDKEEHLQLILLEALRHSTSEGAVTVLRRALDSPNPEWRRRAAGALSTMKMASATSALADAYVTSADETVRAFAAAAYFSTASPDDVIAALGRDDPDTCECLAEVLTERKRPEIVAALEAARHAGSASRRARAARVLKLLSEGEDGSGEPSPIPLADLLAGMQDKRDSRRAAAARRLAEALQARWKERAQRDLLYACSAEQERELRRKWAAGDTAIAGEIVSLLADPSPASRAWIARALGWVWCDAAMAAASRLVSEPSVDMETRRGALLSLGTGADPQVLPLLEQTLSSQEAALRTAALRAIWNIDDVGAVRLLTRGLSDRDREVRLSAIGLLGSRKWLATILPSVFDALAGAADDEDSLVRAEAFGRMRDIAVGHVWDAPAVTRLAASKLRHDPSDSVRANAADLLGVLRGPESCAALVEALDDESVLVRRGVASALRTMSPPAARAGLVRRQAVETQRSVAGALQGAIDAIDETAEHKAAR